MQLLAHHAGEDSLLGLLLLGGTGLSIMVVEGRARLAAARARLTRRARGPERRPHDGRRWRWSSPVAPAWRPRAGHWDDG